VPRRPPNRGAGAVPPRLPVPPLLRHSRRRRSRLPDLPVRRDEGRARNCSIPLRFFRVSAFYFFVHTCLKRRIEVHKPAGSPSQASRSATSGAPSSAFTEAKAACVINTPTAAAAAANCMGIDSSAPTVFRIPAADGFVGARCASLGALVSSHLHAYA
jgi:hypothetical protein